MAQRIATDQDILDFIEQYVRVHGFSPSLADIGRGVGLTSRSAILRRISKLRERGKLTYMDGVPRTIRRADGLRDI